MPRKKTRKVKRKPAKRARAKTSRTTTRTTTRTTVGKLPHAPAGTVAQHMKHVRNLLLNKIGELEAKKLTVTTKRGLNKLRDQIANKKALFNKLF